MVVIVDYGVGNLGSVLNMVKRIGTEAKISSNADDILDAEKLILPGVGAFDYGMKKLYELELISVLNKKVIESRTPILGICLGMQLFAKHSEEGEMKGLSWLDADVVKFDLKNIDIKLKLPHMGWNNIKKANSSILLSDLDDNTRFYFVHSYHLKCNFSDDVVAYTNYGYEFPSIINRGNIFATQFHPEKSHKYGLKLMKNFLELR